MAGNTYIAILFQSLKQNKKLACSKFKTNKQMVKKNSRDDLEGYG